MARILIVEPHPDVHELLARVVERLGHTGVRLEPGGPDDTAVAVVLLEPAAPGGLDRAKRFAAAGIPLVCVSIEPASRQILELEPVAYLQKPFALDDIQAALDRALAA